MFVITAGKAFNDIDAFACAIAYAQLLRFEGKDAVAAFEGPLNHTVTPSVRRFTDDYISDYQFNPGDEFVYVDISDPNHFAYYSGVLTHVAEIYDHHYGWEHYWKEKIGNNSHIERVGAAATLIWEEYVKRGFQNKITIESANLISYAIIQNTLSFKSGETHDRDRVAFEQLQKRIALPMDWQRVYYHDMMVELEENFQETIQNDTKIYHEQNLVFSQFDIFDDPLNFLSKFKNEINTYFLKQGDYKCLINIIGMNSEESVLYSNDSQWLNEKIRPSFEKIITQGDGYIVVPMMQRKRLVSLFFSKI